MKDQYEIDEDQASRRFDRSRMRPAEIAITDAMYAVEEMGADVRLTNAVDLLMKARNCVADYIERNY